MTQMKCELQIIQIQIERTVHFFMKTYIIAWLFISVSKSLGEEIN